MGHTFRVSLSPKIQGLKYENSANLSFWWHIPELEIEENIVNRTVR